MRYWKGIRGQSHETMPSSHTQKKNEQKLIDKWMTDNCLHALFSLSFSLLLHLSIKNCGEFFFANVTYTNEFNEWARHTTESQMMANRCLSSLHIPILVCYEEKKQSGYFILPNKKTLLSWFTCSTHLIIHNYGNRIYVICVFLGEVGHKSVK